MDEQSDGSGQDDPFEIFSQFWFIALAAFVGLLLLVIIAVVVIISCRNRATRRRSFMITDKNEHDSNILHNVIALDPVTSFSNVSNFELTPELGSFTAKVGGSTSSSTLSEITSVAQISRVSQTSSSSQLPPAEDSNSDRRDSIVLDSSELRPLSVCPPPRKRSKRSDYDRLERIPESQAERGRLFIFLPSKQATANDDSVFVENPIPPPRKITLTHQAFGEVSVSTNRSLSVDNRDSSYLPYEDASSVLVDQSVPPCLEEQVSTTIELEKTPDHYSVPSDIPAEAASLNDEHRRTSLASTVRPQSSIYTSIDDVDMELLPAKDRRTSLPLLGMTQSLHLPTTSHLATFDPDRPISSVYANIDDIPDSLLPRPEAPTASARQSSIYTTIDETLSPSHGDSVDNDEKEQQLRKEYSYATSLMLTSPERTGDAGSKDGEFCPVATNHHVYTYIMDGDNEEKDAQLEKNAVDYQNVPAAFLQKCKHSTQLSRLKLQRSMSTPDILLLSANYEENPTTFDSPRKHVQSPQSGVSTHSSSSNSDLVTLQLQEELEQYSSYYNVAQIAGPGGWVVKKDPPVPKEEMAGTGLNDDYHSDLSLWLTPEQKAVRSWSLGSKHNYSCGQQQQQPPTQPLPIEQDTSEGKYTKIFVREVHKHIYERPSLVAAQSRTLGRPLTHHRSHKPAPTSCSYVNQLVWLSSNRPVYPQFHKPQDSDSHYTCLLPATELDDDGYTLPVV